jgi:hypothetical protein
MADKIIKFNPSTYYHNAVIKEPSSAIKDARVIRLVVDSRERNMSIFPNPSNYEINLVENIQNVVHLSLITAEFPFDSYTIHKNNSIIHLAYNDTVYAIELETGNYSETELATELTNALNTVVGSTDFKVEYIARKDNYTFRCKNPFGLVFRGEAERNQYNNSMDTAYISRTMGRLLGFGINNYMSKQLSSPPDAFGNAINSEFKKNFGVDDYIVLRIDAAEVNVSTAESLNRSFAVISKNKTLSVFDEDSYHKKFKPPLGRLPKLKITLTDFYGNLYDFNNQDHKLEFVLICDF